MTTDARRVAAARRWFRTVGNAPMSEDGVTIVATPAYPDTWESNYVCPEPGVGADRVFAAIARHLRHTAWHVVVGDALTDPAIEAELALADFAADGVMIEMLASGPIASRAPLPAITTRPVTGRDDLAAFDALVAIDHAEGLRTSSIEPRVNAGLLAAMHRRMETCDYSLIVADGEPVGYGLAAPCPNGLGLIEHLFTRPDRRGRGIMSAFIVAASDRLHASGCDAIFLDAHAADRPKHLYAALGFAPVACARNWVRGPAG